MRNGKKGKLYRGWLLIIILPAFLAIILRVFFLALYKVPSSSMEPALLSGDIIMVCKTSYGPRVINPIKCLKYKKNECLRLKGRGSIEKSDIVVFNMPLYNAFSGSGGDEMGDCIAKRIYGLPGDSILINNKEISNNGMIQLQDEQLLFPHDTSLHWSLDKYGPLYVPAKGSTIRLTKKNVLYYKDIILYENQDVKIKDSFFNLNGADLKEYRFKQDYYFMLGDNFYSSYDSRYWGFVPEENILGKVVMVVFSVDPNKFGLKKIRWDRLFKPL